MFFGDIRVGILFWFFFLYILFFVIIWVRLGGFEDRFISFGFVTEVGFLILVGR